MEYRIGATDLRQQLTDVLQTVREGQATYLIETFGRPQAALIGLEDYQAYQQYRQEREAFFRWLDAAAETNARLNADLGEDELLALINGVRTEVAAESPLAAALP
ncbi:MAG: type II toxin-antitoxin system Phd/YefM family antitoxin [Chloroflexi bacterium]|nr:type II toxin-antitoxin system Phd/YefM family antitoxin [Chloroflexota bacterium]